MIIILIFLFFFILLCICYIWYIKNLKNSKNVTFLTKEELYDLIVSNHSFYQRFHPHDYHARKITSIDDYMEKIKPEMCQFTLFEKLYLIKCMKHADERLKRIYLTGFDGEKASRIKWKIGCLNGKRYEDGLPHTIDDTIIIERSIITRYSMNDLVDTLIHEKVHLYQKKYKEDVLDYLSTYFKAIGTRTVDKKLRVNPDTDDTIYQEINTNLFYQLPYKTDKPQRINDGLSNFSMEHPFEKMAIDIERM